MGLNSHCTAGANGTAAKMTRYILDTQDNPERVLFVFGVNLVSDPRLDAEAAINEILIYKGDSYDCYPSRLSVPRAEGVTLTEADWKRAAELWTERELHGRPGVFAVHGDSAGSIHLHGVSAFLDPDGKCLSFSGKGAYKEGVRRQAIADELSRELGLTPTPREAGTYTKAKNREGIEAARMREQGKSRWVDRLKACISTAALMSNNRADFVGLMSLQGVNVRYRGSGVSYSFQDLEGKQRLVRGKRLGTDFSPYCEPKPARSPKQRGAATSATLPAPTTAGAGHAAHGKSGGTAVIGGSTGGTRLSEDERQRLGDQAESVQAALDEAQQAVQQGANEVAQNQGGKGR